MAELLETKRDGGAGVGSVSQWSHEDTRSTQAAEFVLAGEQWDEYIRPVMAA